MLEGNRHPIKKGGGSIGSFLLTFFLDHVQAPPIAIAVAGLVGLGLFLWAMEDGLWQHLAQRRGTKAMKMAVTVLVVGGFAMIGMGTLLYWIRTQPAEAQEAGSTPRRGKMSDQSPLSINQQSGQIGGSITNNGPVYNAPVTVAASPVPAPKQAEGGVGGKGGSGEIFGDNGTIIGGHGGRVGPGAVGRGGDGGGGVIHGNGGVIIGGDGGSVDGTNIWYPPARSPLEPVGGDPKLDYGLLNYGQGGMSGFYLEKFNIVGKIREAYFETHDMPNKIKSSKIDDVPLDFINQRLAAAGYPWRAKPEGRWYLFYVP